MNFTKLLMIISLFILLFLSLSNVFALGENLDGNSFESVKEIINSSDDGDVILLDGNYSGSGSEISITKQLTIKGLGDGASFDAQRTSRIFNIQSDNVTLENIIFINGNNSETGGQYITRQII